MKNQNGITDLAKYLLKHFAHEFGKSAEHESTSDVTMRLLERLRKYEDGELCPSAPLEKLLQLRTGRDDAKDRFIVSEVSAAAFDLTNVNLEQIKEAMTDGGMRAKLAFSCDIDCSGSMPVIRTNLQYSVKFKDSRESVMSDPNQQDLPMQTSVSNALVRIGSPVIDMQSDIEQQ